MTFQPLKSNFVEEWWQTLLADASLPKRAHLIGQYIAHSCAGADECSLSFSTLATAAATSRSQAAETVRQLVNDGWLMKSDPTRRTNTYKLLLRSVSREEAAVMYENRGFDALS